MSLRELASDEAGLLNERETDSFFSREMKKDGGKLSIFWKEKAKEKWREAEKRQQEEEEEEKKEIALAQRSRREGGGRVHSDLLRGQSHLDCLVG